MKMGKRATWLQSGRLSQHSSQPVTSLLVCCLCWAPLNSELPDRLRRNTACIHSPCSALGPVPGSCKYRAGLSRGKSHIFLPGFKSPERWGGFQECSVMPSVWQAPDTKTSYWKSQEDNPTALSPFQGYSSMRLQGYMPKKPASIPHSNTLVPLHLFMELKWISVRREELLASAISRAMGQAWAEKGCEMTRAGYVSLKLVSHWHLFTKNAQISKCGPTCLKAVL